LPQCVKAPINPFPRDEIGSQRGRFARTMDSSDAMNRASGGAIGWRRAAGLPFRQRLPFR